VCVKTKRRKEKNENDWPGECAQRGVFVGAEGVIYCDSISIWVTGSAINYLVSISSPALFAILKAAG